jgi:hypothetical protein
MFMSVDSAWQFSTLVYSAVSTWQVQLVSTSQRFTGVLLTAFSAGTVIQQGSYRAAMHILVIFFMPESAFARHGVLNIDTSDKTLTVEKSEKESIEHIEERPTNSGSEVRKSYAKELLPWSGYWDTVSFWRTLLRPFVMILSPIVVWATLLFTICISWLVLISITLSQIFSAPPYNFSVSAVGATNVSSFVASVLATLVAGAIIDGVAKYMSKRNNGVFGKFLLHILTTSRLIILQNPNSVSPSW